MGRQAWLQRAGLARKIGYGILLSGMAAVLAWVGWPAEHSSAATLIGIFLIPVFYVLMQRLAERLRGSAKPAPATPS